MVFFSQIQGRDILDVKGCNVARLKDMTLDFSSGKPVVTGLVFSDRTGKLKKINWRFVESVEKTGIFLNVDHDKLELADFDNERDTLLGDIQDTQVVDIDGLKVVRVNDIILEKEGNNFGLTSIDVGFRGIIRRLGLSKLNLTLFAKVPQKFIKWENIEPLQPQIKNLQLKIPHQKLAELHPADIADLMENLSHKERAVIFRNLDSEKAADALEESAPDVQRSVVRRLKKEKIASILENMAPDEAADILVLLNLDRVNEILDVMSKEKAEVIKGILKYDSDIAGGIMTTEFVSVPTDATADQAIQVLRKNSKIMEHIHNVYVVDSEHHLAGVVSMKDLIFNSEDTKVENIMKKRLVKVSTHSGAEEIERLFKRYNLLSLPVVNEDNRLVGVITHDDIYDMVLARV